MQKKELITKVAILVILIVIAILSATVVSDYATSAKVHADSIKKLDEKKMTAMQLTATVTATSALISALPGDAATPIAEQVSELTMPLLIVVCAIYLEKFLLTTLGYISFTFLIPIACGIFAIYLFWKQDFVITLAIRISVFALAISAIIPVSITITNLIEATFEESITQTFETVDKISEEAEESTEEEITEEESKGFFDFLTGIGQEVTDFTTTLTESAKNALSVFIDAIAVLIITTCVIPIAVLFLFVWLIKIIFGIEINMSNVRRRLPMRE
ncbi:MAG: hypothetical protein IKJ01_08155 [Lachnospiraceae bacterium]|nr:hypothetical protein [Lachnospiraceae bacterium]